MTFGTSKKNHVRIVIAILNKPRPTERFIILVAKHHSDLYSLLNEIQKEQADSKIMVTELSLGRRVKAAPKRKWLEVLSRLWRIVENYNEYKTEGKELEFLKPIAYNINIWLKCPSEYLIFFFKLRRFSVLRKLRIRVPDEVLNWV